MQMASLPSHRYAIVSTGGTASALEDAGVSVTTVEKLTNFPEMVSCLLSCPFYP